MSKLFFLLFYFAVCLSPITYAQSPLQQDSINVLKTLSSFFKQRLGPLSLARNQALAVREKYFCLDPSSNTYIQGTITQFDGNQKKDYETWIVIHQITGCQFKHLEYSKAAVSVLNYGWETYELFGEREPLKFYRNQSPNPKDRSYKKAFKDYAEDTERDMKAIFEGYNTDGQDCVTRFVPPVCLTYEELQARQIDSDRIVFQKVWDAREDRTTRTMDKLSSPDIDKKIYQKFRGSKIPTRLRGLR